MVFGVSDEIQLRCHCHALWVARYWALPSGIDHHRGDGVERHVYRLFARPFNSEDQSIT
jgi:hypothetical protein